MPETDAHRAAEAHFKQLVEDAALPRPDRVEYEPRAVLFYWDEPKAVVIVDLDEPDPARVA
jgi:hypothetical protein